MCRECPWTGRRGDPVLAPRARPSTSSRVFAKVDRPPRAQPPSRGEPRPRWADRAFPDLPRDRVLPPVEPRRRAHWIDARAGTQVLAEIEQHIPQPSASLAGRLQRSRVIPLRPHSASPSERAVDRLRASNCQALHPANQSNVVVRFDDEVHVVGLHREVNHPEEFLRRPRQRPPHGRKRPLAPQRGNLSVRPQCDMHGMPSLVHRPSPMRRPRPRPNGSSPGTSPPASPGSWHRKAELPRRASHSRVVGLLPPKLLARSRSLPAGSLPIQERPAAAFSGRHRSREARDGPGRAKGVIGLVP
jgi:hypothetical protein